MWDVDLGIWILGCVLVAVSLAGCGKKGPPLAPIVHIPAAVDKLAAARVGNDVYLTLTIPTQNIDMSTPADVNHIDVFGVTSLTPPPLTRIFEIATKVASVEVQPPPPPTDKNATSAPVTTRPDLPAQGTIVTLRDHMTPDALLPKELPAAPVRGRATAASSPTPPPTPSAVLPRRFYVAVATSERGRTGPPGTLVEMPLLPLPDPPPAPTVSATPDNLVVAWEPSGGLVGFLFEKPAAPEESPVDEPVTTEARSAAPVAPSGPVLYNVYRVPSPAEARQAAPAPATSRPPAPLNAAPLTTLTFTDASPYDYGVDRCYSVRAIRGSGPAAVIGDPSPSGCITPIDRDPPAPPTGLAALGAEGAIALSWEPNGEADLGGYLVLRGRAGDATLQPLTDAPVTETRYTDTNVMPGERYVYAVKAVDRQSPPNVSEESNRAEETAR